MLRFSILSILVSLFNVMAARAEPSFILVDHSATMAAEDKQSELNILLSYHSKKFRQTGYSVTYMGGENGGYCRGEVDIVEPRMEEDYRSFDPLFRADGNSPVLRSLHSIYSQIGDASTNIVVVTDGENVCGGGSALCQAARTFREDFPKVNLQFEPVFATFESRSFECLNQPVSHEEVRVADIHLPFNYHPITIAQQSKPKLTGWSYYILLLLFLIMVWGAWWVYLENKNREDISGVEDEQPDRTGTRPAEVEGKTALFKGFQLSMIGYLERIGLRKYRVFWVLIALVCFGMLPFLQYKSQLIVGWNAALANMDSRLGSALSSTFITGFLGWWAFQIWNNTNEKLKSDFKRKLDAYTEREDLRERLSLKQSILVSFENYEDGVSIPSAKQLVEKSEPEREYWEAYQAMILQLRKIKNIVETLIDDQKTDIKNITKNYRGLDLSKSYKTIEKRLKKTAVSNDEINKLNSCAAALKSKKEAMRRYNEEIKRQAEKDKEV